MIVFDARLSLQKFQTCICSRCVLGECGRVSVGNAHAEFFQLAPLPQSFNVLWVATLTTRFVR